MPIKVIATIEPINDADFPIVADKHVKGGFHVCTDTTERDNIPTASRKIGMLVYVESDEKFYLLRSGLTNSDWEVKDLTSGGGSSRPTNPLLGQMFFDTILNQPIWWNGTAWTDATGNPPPGV